MKCPACSNELTARLVSGVTLDVCDNGCGGIWFDQFEFKKFDEPSEPDAETILNIKIQKTPASESAEHYDCPRCDGVKMMRHFASVKRKVTMDECPMCAGVWLDAGELSAIRNEFPSEEARKAAAEHLFSEMFGPALIKEHQHSVEKAERAQKFAKAFRFICPSYYIPGKQDGGAF